MAKKQRPAKGRSKGKGNRYDRIVLIGIVIALAAIALTLWGPLEKFTVQKDKKQVRTAKKAEQQHQKNTGEARKHGDRAKAKGESALVAIIIDDLGQDLKLAEEISSLPAKITFAVMPGLPNSKKVAHLAKKTSREVLLHLPMEHRGKNGKQAPGVLRSDMTPMDFLDTLNGNLASVPGAVGVNNHEGSSLTENKEAMKFLMAELKARELFFLDSFTSSDSVGYITAKEFGLRTARRDVFLDNDINQDAIRKQLEELSRMAKEHGRAIGIGHPHPATISELRRWLAAAPEQGVVIVPVSKIIN